MTLDVSIIGAADETVTVKVDPARQRAFAEAIGEHRDLYLDGAAARAAGYPDIPVPPTYHFSLGRERSRLFTLLEDRGVDPLKLLHGEQHFRYAAITHAGDTLTRRATVSDYFEKKDGALKFIVMETDIRKPDGELVSLAHETLVLPEAAPPPGGPKAAQPPLAAQAGALTLGQLRPGAVTREMLARFGPASGDLNRVHLDAGAARSAGYDDVFAHGMLSMAWLGRLLTDHVRQERLREFGVRFLALTPVDAVPVCEGVSLGSGSQHVTLQVRLENGPATLTGAAKIG